MKKNDNSHVHLVIMAGGGGTRFWPKSRASKPKQFLTFGETHLSLLATTLNRFTTDVVPTENRWIVTSKSLEKLVLAENLNTHMMIEPTLKGTCCAVYAAAKKIISSDEKAVMVIAPSDHWITDVNSFLESLSSAVSWAANQEDIAILGVIPTRPETGFGYLHSLKKETSLASQLNNPKIIDRFIEKPSRAEASTLASSGSHLWNSGIYCFQAKMIIDIIETKHPELKILWEKHNGDLNLIYNDIAEPISLEYAILQNLNHLICFQLQCGWDDIGVWHAIEAQADQLKARRGSNTVTQGEVLSIESNGNIVDSDNCLVALLGVDNLIVVQSQGALLIAKKNRSQDVKKLVEELKSLRPDLL